MPSVRKLSSNTTRLLPKVGKDLTVFATPLSGSNLDSISLPSEFNMECSTLLDVFTPLDLMQGLGNDELSDHTSSPARKRERLDHLSQEEKLMRRKMKNRVAAQTARDRKKARMSELEDQVAELETQRSRLLLENFKLKTKNSKLEEENLELKQRLSSASLETSHQDAKSIKAVEVLDSQDCMDVEEPLEYASLISDPLQKEQDLKLLSLLMTQYIYLPVIARLMLYLIYCSSAAMNYSNLITLTPAHPKVKVEECVNPQKIKWWGPHQKAWNPSKN